MMNKHFLLVVVCLFLIDTKLANADQLQDRLTVLEKTIQTMQGDSVSRNEKVASALAVIEQLKIDYQSIQGTIEANTHQLETQKAEIARLRQDIDNRIASIEERLEIYDIQVTRAVAKVLPQASSEIDAYQKALDMVYKSDYLSAVSAFRVFLKSYPKSELADNSQYWIGECYYAMKDFQKAIKEFQLLSEKYPKSDKAAGAILKQGFSFAELSMLEEAKIFLNKVIKDYPGSDEAVKAHEKISNLEQKINYQQNTTPADTSGAIPLAPGVKNQPPAPETK